MAYIGNPAAPTLAQVADDSVTSAKIAAGAVGSSDLASNLDLTGSLTVDGTTLVVDDTNNRVGIGTASPAARLQINATTGVSGDDLLRLISGPDGAELVVDTAANTVRMLTGAGDAFVFGTAGTERLRILSSGGITFNGDTAAANALDDYEEGTWTPVASAGSGSLTSYTSEGTYIKIGKQVFVRGKVALTNVGTASNIMVVNNLPFTTGSGQRPFVGVSREDLQTGNTFLVYGDENGTSFRISALTGVGGITWTNGYGYIFSVTYIAA